MRYRLFHQRQGGCRGRFLLSGPRFGYNSITLTTASAVVCFRPPNPAAPVSAASQRWTERAALSIGSLHATLRSVFHRPSGPERAGAGDDRALPRHGDLEERQDPPARGLGPPPARFSAVQGAQGALRPHEYRV